MQLIPIGRDGSFDGPGTTPHPALREVLSATVALYEKMGFHPPWVGYVAIENSTVVGTCGFAAPPNGSEAEIAYFTFPGNEGSGVATRMATALLAVSQTQAKLEGVTFVAHTLPANGPSTSILRKLGFSLLGSIQHPDDGAVWKWKLQNREA